MDVIRRSGRQILDEPSHQAGGERIAQVSDPDGKEIIVVSPGSGKAKLREGSISPGPSHHETPNLKRVHNVSLPFRAGTVSWDVLRRPVFLLGGMRALLLQISEPGIAAGVAEHSDFTNRVFDRMRDTVELIVEVGLGDPTEAQRAVMEMNRAHRGVRGKMPDGSTYDAGQPELRLWVLTTLIDTVLVVEATYVGEFREEERARYYRESLEIARVLEVADPPQTLDEFHRYMTERFDSLTITDHARQIAHHVLYPDLGWTPQWSLAPIRAITADLLPARLREGYGLSLSPRQARWLRRFQALSRATLPRMPDWIRTYPLLRPIAGLKDRISHSRNQEE